MKKRFFITSLFLISLFASLSASADFCSIKSVVRDSNKRTLERANQFIDIDKSSSHEVNFQRHDINLKISQLGKMKPIVESNLKKQKVSVQRITKYGQRYVIVKALGVLPFGYMGIIKKKYLEATLECPII